MYLDSARSILSRQPISTTGLTPLQVQVDGLSSAFLSQATDLKSLAALTVGGAAYRLGRVGFLGLGGGGVSRAVSLATGLGAEVTAYEVTHRGLQSIGGQGHPNLWSWNGPGGLRQGLLQSSITFGTLRGAGRIVQGENIFVQHMIQDAAMVVGHNASGTLGIADRPTGTIAEQFLHAEATLWQVQAGMSLVHGLAPRLLALERGLDLSLPVRGSGLELGDAGHENYAWAALSGSGRRAAPRAVEDLTGPSVVWMSGKPKGTDGGNPSPAKASASGSGERPRAEVPELEPFWVDENARSTAEASPDGYITINERGLILYANPAIHELLGYEKQDLVGRPLTALIPPSFRRNHERGLQRYLTTGTKGFDHRKGGEFSALHANGSWVQVNISLQESAHGRDRFFTGVVRRNGSSTGRPEGSVERTPLPSPPPKHERSGRFSVEEERLVGPAPKGGRSAAETSYIGLKVDKSGGKGSSSSDLARLQRDLANAVSDFRAKTEGEGDIEIRIPTLLSKEFLEANREEVVSAFHNRVWGYMVRTGRKVSLIFQMSGNSYKLDLVKAADVGYKLAE